MLNAAQWVRLDDDNGYPWTYILAEAIAAKDRTAIDDALFHIGAASRFEQRGMAVSGIIARQAGDSEEERFAAEKMGEAAANPSTPHMPLSSISRSCSKDALLDPNRSELCESAASTLTERADSLLATAIGSGIGHRLEWPSDRFELIDAIHQAAIDAAPRRDQQSLSAGRVIARVARLHSDRQDAALCPGRRLARRSGVRPTVA